MHTAREHNVQFHPLCHGPPILSLPTAFHDASVRFLEPVLALLAALPPSTQQSPPKTFVCPETCLPPPSVNPTVTFVPLRAASRAFNPTQQPQPCPRTLTTTRQTPHP
ncbi:hypothetical protein P154DRAFT_531511 [Amniculicola lignicola CBS 123094]|uniref:Uncharacterized protein n=1 Tax=Amniculicola lignicola CBS 123094 TaxID=1392246 RepID=A0A6A5WUD1_9PLEO|nr:hypothetical protein P154DRAFT_531511 [Amniculicola lignicola CBS 123094]